MSDAEGRIGHGIRAPPDPHFSIILRCRSWCMLAGVNIAQVAMKYVAVANRGTAGGHDSKAPLLQMACSVAST